MARQVKVITAAEAAALIKNGDTVTTSGFVASAIPEALDRAVEERFWQQANPEILLMFTAVLRVTKMAVVQNTLRTKVC